MDTTFIYALNDPETGECRYVGKADAPKTRLIKHLAKGGRKCYCKNWINSLASRGLKPLLEILQEVPRTEWQTWERIWIKASREIGMRLTNWHPGGVGPGNGKANPFFGRKHSPEARAVMRVKSQTKRVASGPNHYAFGKSPSLETRAKMRAGHEGRVVTPEASAKHRIKKSVSSSKFHGVFWSPEREKWRAILSKDNKQVYIGLFPDEIDAAHAYDATAKQCLGSYAKLNFPIE